MDLLDAVGNDSMAAPVAPIRIDGAGTYVSHRPLPFAGAKAVRSSDMTELHVKEFTGPSGLSYRLHATMLGGQSKLLLRGLDTVQEADFIAEKIQQYCGTGILQGDGPPQQPGP